MLHRLVFVPLWGAQSLTSLDMGSHHFFLPKSPLRMLLKGEKTGIRVYGCGRVRSGEGKPTKLCLAGSFFSILASRTSLHEPFVPFVPFIPVVSQSMTIS